MIKGSAAGVEASNFAIPFIRLCRDQCQHTANVIGDAAPLMEAPHRLPSYQGPQAARFFRVRFG